MNRFLISLVIFFTTLCMSGCEGYKCGDGKVVDEQTKEPLDSVLCKVITGSETAFTDTSGTFAVCNRISGCMFGCKDIVIRFTKEGYDTLDVENPPSGAFILLSRR